MSLPMLTPDYPIVQCTVPGTGHCCHGCDLVFYRLVVSEPDLGSRRYDRRLIVQVTEHTNLFNTQWDLLQMLLLIPKKMS